MTVPRVCRRAPVCFIRLILIWFVFLVSALGGLRPYGQVSVRAQQSRAAKGKTLLQAASPGQAGYVGSAACSRCHAGIYASFSQTRMGRSLTPAIASSIKGLSLPVSIESAELDRLFEVYAENGKLYESESQPGADGHEVFRSSQQVEWIIGAGANGFGGLVKRGDFLFEAPVSFYAKPAKWELSPGYEHKDIGFNRPVLAGCISCHSGRPRPADQTSGKFAPVPFAQAAIGCENCHGPGAEHIRTLNGSNAVRAGSQIVNPGRLSADLENDICMSCHEAGDSRVLKPGKTYQDFRPGTPLDDTLSIFMVPRRRSDPEDSDHVQHYYEMSMSQCYRASAGQLRCATCHDPHVEPTRAEAPAYFNAKCMECHASRPCTQNSQARQQTTPADNCIACHMPERSVPETAHTSLTNHRITARPGEPWPEAAFEQPTAALPGLIHLNRVAGRTDELPQLSVLEAYREISERKPEYAAYYRKALGELELANPDTAAAQLALGRGALQNGDAQKAIEHLRRSLELDPGQGAAYGYLSEALQQRGQIAEAVAASDEAVKLQPYDPLLQKALIDRLIEAQQYGKAEAAMERYVKEFPEDSFVRQMLALAKQ